jgi:thioesterase domain-containing protein
VTVLAGYSRGGCTAIIAARRLKDRGVGVYSLFLFDAVLAVAEWMNNRKQDAEAPPALIPVRKYVQGENTIAKVENS